MNVTRQELLNQLFGNGLYLALASEGIQQKQNEEIREKYDQLTDAAKMSGEGAAGIIYAAYGSKNHRTTLDNIKVYVQAKLVELGYDAPNGFESPVRTLNEATGSAVSEFIGRQLGKLGNAPAIETCYKKRFSELLKRINLNIDKCSVTVGGQDLSEFARAQSKLKIAECFNETTSFTATASHKVGNKEFKEFSLDILI